MKTIVYYNEDFPTAKKAAETLANSLGGTYVPSGVTVETIPEEYYSVRETAVRYAIDYIAAKGSNPQTDLIGLADRIAKFIEHGTTG